MKQILTAPQNVQATLKPLEGHMQTKHIQYEESPSTNKALKILVALEIALKAHSTVTSPIHAPMQPYNSIPSVALSFSTERGTPLSTK